MADTTKTFTYDDYTVAIICPLEVEMTAVRCLLDEEHKRLPLKDGDRNRYILGKMGKHRVAIAFLPRGSQGIGAAAIVATDMRRTFPSAQLRLLVGIGGGIPSKKNDIRLGDVVVGMPDGIHGGVVQYDLGKRTVDGFERKGFLQAPPDEWRTAVVDMMSEHKFKPNQIDDFLSKMLEKYPKLQEYSRPAPDLDVLFPPDTIHVRDEQTCDRCDKSNAISRRGSTGPRIFYGTIASGDSVVKDATVRDELSETSGGALCFEMEAAGLSDGKFPCVVVRGICDYADSHKNEQWHSYAAGAAAACAKELLTYMDPIPGTYTCEECFLYPSRSENLYIVPPPISCFPRLFVLSRREVLTISLSNEVKSNSNESRPFRAPPSGTENLWPRRTAWSNHVLLR
jgi:nucleoside phosphorylase